MSTDPISESTTTGTPENVGSGSRLLHVLAFGSILVPILCIPYIPIRRHLLGLRKSIHTLSSNTTLIQHGLSNTLANAQLRQEETLKLANQLHDLRVQYDVITKRVAEYENSRLVSERDVAERLRVASDRAAAAEATRAKSEDVLRRRIDILRKRADRERRVFSSC